MSHPHEPDILDQAIAQADKIEARIATKTMPLVRDDGTRSVFTLGLPDDLRDEDFIAIVEGTTAWARVVLQQIAQRRNGGLVVARGALPSLGASLR